MSRVVVLAAAGGLLCLTPAAAGAQTIEWIGTRALGMAGAFVGVADDASAVYWNPAGLATGATASGIFEIGRDDVVADKNAAIDPTLVGSRAGTRLVATVATSFGVTNYRLAFTELVPAGERSTFTESPSIGPALARLSTSNYGATLLQTVAEGVVVGGTVRLVRATTQLAAAPVSGTVDDALDSAEDLPSKRSTTIDLDFGAMLVFGVARAGLVVRNLRQPEFELPGSTSTFTLKRHARVGLAVTPGRGAYAPGASTNIGLDFDLTRVETPRGRQRDLSVGLEQWLAGRRLGVRGGLRFNVLDKDQRATAVGLSAGLRANFYLDAHLTRGRQSDDRGWSIAARATF